MSRRSVVASKAADQAGQLTPQAEASPVDVLAVLVLAAAAVVLCLGLVVLLGNPERRGRPVYPDRQASPEVRERQDSLDRPVAEWEETIMTADMETSREEDEIPTIPEKDTGKAARKERKNK